MDKKRKILASFLLLCVFSLAFNVAAYAADDVAEITRELICSCGCGKVTYDCYCDLAKEWKEQIANNLAEGKTKKQIINGFVEKYGDQVLATPKKTGLELTIWTIPVFASILGTVFIYSYAKKKAPIPDTEIDASIIEPAHARDDDVNSTIQRYDEIFYEEYIKAKKKDT